MFTLQRRVIVVLSTILIGLFTSTTSVAQTGRTLYVDDTGTADAARSGRCGRPNYASVQAAVNDVSALRVVVCRGTYVEQVRVERSLTLEGRAGAVIQAPATLNTSGMIVSFAGPQQSRLLNLTISGSGVTDTTLYAALDVRDGAEVSVTGNRIRDIGGVGPSCTNGNGIYIDGGRADITENSIERYGGEGILVTSGGTFAMIDDNTIRGRGLAVPCPGQIGVDIREGAAGDMEDNTVTGNATAGIIVDQTGDVSIRDNIVTNNEEGIILGDESGGIELRSNEVRNNNSYGIRITDASSNLVVENTISNNGGDGVRIQSADPSATNNVIESNTIRGNNGNGISLDIGAINNHIADNEINDNNGLDILDENGQPLANVYDDNDCDTSNPDGLCDD